MNWQKLSNILSTKYGKLINLIPILTFFLYLVYSQDETSILIKIFEVLNIKWTPTIFWSQLLFLYGLILMSIATMLYQLFCPSIIKKYKSDDKYIESQKNTISNEKKMKIYSYLIKNGYSFKEDHTSISLKSLLYDEFEVKNKKRSIVLYLVPIFYSIGVMLCAIPTIYKIYIITVSVF